MILPFAGVLTRDQTRDLDRRAMDEFRVPGIVLMENAGRGVAELIVFLLDSGAMAEWNGNPSHRSGGGWKTPPWERRLPADAKVFPEHMSLPASGRKTGQVAILCGRGNNGGDGFVIARHLRLRGIGVMVFHVGSLTEYPADAAVMAEILRRDGTLMVRIDPVTAMGEPDHAAMDTAMMTLRLALGESASVVENAQVEPVVAVVDALLGTGTCGAPRSPLDVLIGLMNTATARPGGPPIVAVDLPSGLDADTGLPTNPTVRATHTATFSAQKPGFFRSEAIVHLGRVHVIDIGAPASLVESMVGYPAM